MSAASPSFVIATYAATVAALVAFASAALVLARREHQRQAAGVDASAAVEFITAQASQPTHRIAWSFFAGSLGAWAIATPPLFAVSFGIVGMVAYAVSSGLPIVLVALAGDRVRARHPRCSSLADFCRQRFQSRAVQVLIAAIVAINMAVALLAEYVVIGSLFRDHVGSLDYPIVIVVASLVAAYTAVGGLRISIITDQFQGVLVVLLATVITVYVAATFRIDPAVDGPLPPSLGATVAGWQQLFVLPVSLTAGTFCSDAMWQRIWAAKDAPALKRGACIAAGMLCAIILLFSICGLLVAWKGLIHAETDNPNLYLFKIFGDQAFGWPAVITIVLAATMNESAVDSMQNALVATFASNFNIQRVAWVRALVFLINAPLVVIALQPIPVLSLFLVTNLITTGAMPPLIAGIIDHSGSYFGYVSVLASICSSVLALSVYGIARMGAFGSGMAWAWYDNGYDATAFAVSLAGSLVALFVCPAIGWVYRTARGRKHDDAPTSKRQEGKPAMIDAMEIS